MIRALDIISHLKNYRFTFPDEKSLQEGIARSLDEASISFEREYRLSGRDIVDFFVPGGICLEVKIDGSSAAVIRQLHRYALSSEVVSLILVTTRPRHTMPPEMNGKPVHVVALNAGGLL